MCCMPLIQLPCCALPWHVQNRTTSRISSAVLENIKLLVSRKLSLKQRPSLKKRRRSLWSPQPPLHPLLKRKSQMQMLNLQLYREQPVRSLWSLVWHHPPEQEKERSLKLKLKRKKINRWCFGVWPHLLSCYIQRAGWTLLLGTQDKSRDYSWEKSTPAPLLALLSWHNCTNYLYS